MRAKGDVSPYMTDKFREQIEVAKKHLAPYTTVERAKHKGQQVSAGVPHGSRFIRAL